MAYIINTLVYADRHNKGEQQINFLADIKNLGADGVEARLEYFTDFEHEAPLFVAKAKELNLKINLSVPAELFVEGAINKNLDEYFKNGAELNVAKIKFNTGDFANFNGDLAAIFKLLPAGIELNVENDQTKVSGNSQLILNFLNSANEAGYEVGYVYDLGNWLVTNEDPNEVAQKMAPFIRYVHLKNMTGNGNETANILDNGKLDWKKPAEFINQGVDVALEYPMADFDVRSSELNKVKRVYR